MSTDAFRQEHAQLLEHIERIRSVADRLPAMDPSERGAELRPILEFLRNSLIPHAEAEERVLYPAVAALLGNPKATATMISDHRAIVHRIDALETTAPEDLPGLQELLYGLHALLIVHFHKEEDDYLPLLEERPPAEVDGIFRRMGEQAHHAH